MTMSCEARVIVLCAEERTDWIGDRLDARARWSMPTIEAWAIGVAMAANVRERESVGAR